MPPTKVHPPDTRFAAVFDIDGTLADNTHRRHYVEQPKGKKDWKSFNAGMGDDVTNRQVVTVLHAVKAVGLTIVLATGRGEEHRQETEVWLTKHLISYDLLLMRPAKDFRPDTEIKREMLDEMRGMGIEPYFVVDDRNSVVAMWRGEGLVTFQVAEGDF